MAAGTTYASGSWVDATGVFTVASGDPEADGVLVGEYAIVHPDADAPAFVGLITDRDETTITVSLEVANGTAPVDGTEDTTLIVGYSVKGDHRPWKLWV